MVQVQRWTPAYEWNCGPNSCLVHLPEYLGKPLDETIIKPCTNFNNYEMLQRILLVVLWKVWTLSSEQIVKGINNNCYVSSFSSHLSFSPSFVLLLCLFLYIFLNLAFYFSLSLHHPLFSELCKFPSLSFCLAPTLSSHFLFLLFFLSHSLSPPTLSLSI